MASLRFTLQMTCDNAAFEDDAADEVARILRKIGRALTDGTPDDDGGYAGGVYQTVLDANGLDVGRWRFTTRVDGMPFTSRTATGG